jgi:hypothetical protein
VNIKRKFHRVIGRTKLTVLLALTLVGYKRRPHPCLPREQGARGDSLGREALQSQAPSGNVDGTAGFTAPLHLRVTDPGALGLRSETTGPDAPAPREPPHPSSELILKGVSAWAEAPFAVTQRIPAAASHDLAETGARNEGPAEGERACDATSRHE